MKMKACRVFATALFAASAVLLKSAGAQDLLSGHVGVATPIVTWTGARTKLRAQQPLAIISTSYFHSASACSLRVRR